MFYWILSTIINSVSTIFWKKALWMSNVSKYLFAILWNSPWIIIFLLFLYFWYFNLNIFLDFKIVLVLFFWLSLSIFWWFIQQKLYTINRISDLAPYDNLDKLFIIIIWFFIYWNTSIFSLFIAILTVLLISLFTLNFKKLRFPKSFWLIVLSKFLNSIKILIIGYILLKYTFQTVTALEAIISFLIYLSLLKVSDYKAIKTLKKDFLFNRYLGSILSWIAYLISLFLISDLWLTISTLLWFLWLGFTLILSYFFLWDKPDKKNIILALIVFILVSIGYYFK